jgi:hypothetical protein
MSNLTACLLLLTGATFAAGESINPITPPVLAKQIAHWTFDAGTEGWRAQNQCSLTAESGTLQIISTGQDPYFHCPVNLPGGQMVMRIRARGRTGGGGTIFWTTPDSPRGEDKTSHFGLEHDNQWHEYETRFVVEGRVIDLRIDPGIAAGNFEIDWIRLIHEERHPLSIDGIEIQQSVARVQVTNHREQPVTYTAAGESRTIAGEATQEVEIRLDPRKALQAVTLALEVPEFAAYRRTFFVHQQVDTSKWLTRALPNGSLRVSGDGSLAHLERDGQLVAILGPLVHIDGKIPQLQLRDENGVIRLHGEDIQGTLTTDGDEIHVALDCETPCCGPVVRVRGALQQGLLAGLEYLGRGEASSTKLDLVTPEHLRYAPDPLKVTMPLMAFVTDQASVAMTWSDMQLQPRYATPNFFDDANDHYMALEGKTIRATIRLGHEPLEEAILWATKKQGLPPLPDPPRTPEQQMELCLAALNGPLKTEKGWGHCVEERWTRQPYAGVASTVWRLTGEAPPFPNYVPGGTHVSNEAVYFVTGRVQQWLDWNSRRAAGHIQRQQPDGSFRYEGKYRRGHFENTASGICARPAADLLEYAWFTGDKQALQAGLKTLDYMKRFHTPRGAQVWEVPLHTPDQLASASAVMAYVRGYQLTGEAEYLALARKWALTGIPFTYLWGNYPIMVYSTPPVFGATNWVGPVWIGKPVQWVGGVYAYALTKLAPYDDTLDWNHLARGILITAEQMQYPDGESVGLLPDAFEIKRQQRLPARINPCAIVSLRMVLDGQLDSLAVASNNRHRVVAPFPLTLRDGEAVIDGQRGVEYQMLVDGERIVDVVSQGKDVVSLD